MGTPTALFSRPGLAEFEQAVARHAAAAKQAALAGDDAELDHAEASPPAAHCAASMSKLPAPASAGLVKNCQERLISKILVAQHVALTFEGKAEALGLRAKSLILLVGAPGLEPGTR